MELYATYFINAIPILMISAGTVTATYYPITPKQLRNWIPTGWHRMYFTNETNIISTAGHSIYHTTQYVWAKSQSLTQYIDLKQEAVFLKEQWSYLCNPVVTSCFNTLRPRQDGRHFAYDTFKCIFLNENVWIPIEILLKYVPKGRIDNIPALV